MGPEDSTAPTAGSSRIQASTVGSERDDKHVLSHELSLGLVKNELSALLSFVCYVHCACS